MIQGFLRWRQNNRLVEDLEPKIADYYRNVKRNNKKVEERLNEIFDKIEQFPGAKVLMDGPEGKRISIPFNRTITEKPKKGEIEKEVESALNDEGYNLIDYIEGTVLDRYGRTVKLNSALKKIKRDDLIERVNTDKVREGSKQYIVIFSTLNLDYAEQTTGRGWEKYSCKSVYKAQGKQYLKPEIEGGSFICYLAKLNDTNLKSPTGRVVFHPFQQVGNPEIVSYQPDKAYGTIPNDFVEFANRVVRNSQKYNSGKLTLDPQRFYCDLGYSRDLFDPDVEDSIKGISIPTKKKSIEQVLDYFGILDYTINADMTVDVRGNVDLRNKKLVGIPLKFGKVDGVFLCSENEIKSLEGCPHTVKGFGCGNNRLTSLVGGPKIVAGSYVCINNNLGDLTGAPKKIGGTFLCSGCNLQSLSGHPSEVGGEFDCSGNQIKSFEGVSMNVGEIFDCTLNFPPVTQEQRKIIKENVKAVSFEF